MPFTSSYSVFLLSTLRCNTILGAKSVKIANFTRFHLDKLPPVTQNRLANGVFDLILYHPKKTG